MNFRSASPVANHAILRVVRGVAPGEPETFEPKWWTKPSLESSTKYNCLWTSLLLNDWVPLHLNKTTEHAHDQRVLKKYFSWLERILGPTCYEVDLIAP